MESFKKSQDGSLLPLAAPVAGAVIQRLESVQRGIRKLSDILPIPGTSSRELTPTLPLGEEFERFRNPLEALKSWDNKQTQWWYFTGHLTSAAGRKFGFQLVFFERHAHQDFFGVMPTRWVFEEFFVAHFAITNPGATGAEKPFRYFQRGGIFAGETGFSSTDHFHVEVGGWHAYRRDDGVIVIHATHEGDSIHLELKTAKALCYHGQKGYTQKARDPRDASFYCSYTRLQAQGRLILDGQLHAVTGSAWMDHEKMTADDRILHHGWDWFSLQLSSGEELMLYMLRDKDGRKRPEAMGTLFDADGKAHSIASSEVLVEPVEYWKSERSKAHYPIRHYIRVPKLALSLEVSPLLKDQEMDTSRTSFNTYWEGAVETGGVSRGTAVDGRGYLELVGYDKRAKSQLFRFLTVPSTANA